MATEKKVKVFIPRDPTGKGDPNFYVSVNGKSYLLPRGKESEVPPEIANEIQRSFRAQSRLDEYIAAQKQKSVAPQNQINA